jgi:UDP-N-acetylglucosamine acyltransferase
MGGSGIHPLAFVDPAAKLGDGVKVGPFAVIGAGVEIGDDTEIGGGAHVQGPTKIGRENRIHAQAAIGFDPQDLKFQGEEVRLEIGDRNQFREFCTVHRGTSKGCRPIDLCARWFANRLDANVFPHGMTVRENVSRRRGFGL